MLKRYIFDNRLNLNSLRPEEITECEDIPDILVISGIGLNKTNLNEVFVALELPAKKNNINWEILLQSTSTKENFCDESGTI